MDLTQTTHLSEELFIHSVDDESVLLDTRSENFYGLNEVSNGILTLLQEGHTLQKVIETLNEAYGIPVAQLSMDVEAFVADLAQKGIITLSEPA